MTTSPERHLPAVGPFPIGARSIDRPRATPSLLAWRRAAAHSILVVVLLLLASCDNGIPGSGREPTISEEHFVAAMAELRYEALRRTTGQVPPEERERILAEHGISGEDLIQYAEVHGPNVPLMNRVWSSVEERVQRRLLSGVEGSEP